MYERTKKVVEEDAMLRSCAKQIAPDELGISCTAREKIASII